jgi:hypothetical protein
VTSPVIAQPDLEAHVWAQLRDLKGVTSFGYAATQLDSFGWIMAHFVQVDARHKTKRGGLLPATGRGASVAPRR